MNMRNWTVEEDEYILDNFDKISFREMSKKLNCSIGAIQNRLNFLGVIFNKKTRKRWTEEEIELLKIMSTKYLNKTIAKKLGRSVNEINKKARQLNIKLIFKRPVWNKKKIKYLMENINKLSLTQIQKDLDVNYYQIIEKIEELGIEYSNNSWSSEEENILIELSSKIYAREIAKILNRTEGAIFSKLRSMGLDYIVIKKDYTQGELLYIKENWGVISINDMARQLGVSRIMIQAQADKLGLNKLGNNPYRKWTKEEIDKLKNLSTKKSITELAKLFNTTNDAITTVAYKNDIKLNDSKVHWTEEDTNMLIEFAKTMDLSELAEKLNKSTSAVRLQALRKNIYIMPNKKSKDSIWKSEDSEKLISLVKEGKSLIEICAIMNKKDNTVLKKAKELGLSIKKEQLKLWTEEEIEKLKELAKTKKINELVLELNRTSSSIKAMAKKVGIEILSDRKNWTEEEYELLEKLTMVDKKTPKEIAEILGRTEDAIIIKINRRGLQIQTNDKRFWTKEEEILLQDLWGSESFEAIAKKMSRTVSSIKNKANQLGLGAVIENNYNGLTIKEISELLNININTISVAWVGLGLKYKIQKISKSKSYRYVEIKDLYEFLEKNQNIWDSRNLEKNILGIEPEWLKIKRKKDMENNPELERLNLTKQQLILSKKFFLNLKEHNELEEDVLKLALKKGKEE